MGIKDKAAKKIMKEVSKRISVDKIIDGSVDNIKKSISADLKQEQTKLENKIENIKNIEVKSNGEDIIKFFIEAKRNIKDKNISDKEYSMWFLKIDEVYEKAQETIKDEKILKKITKKYEEIKRHKKIKNYGWVAFILFYIALGICIFFGLKGMFWIGLGIAVLVCTGISFMYFNIDFSNISKSIKNFQIKDTDENYIFLATTILGIMIIGYSIMFGSIQKEEQNEAYNNYYNKNVEKYKVVLDVDFKENILFNKCDITLNLYDIEEYYSHGENKKIEIELPKGTHTIEFSGNDDTENIKLKIDGNTKVKYRFECLSGGISISQTSINELKNN